MSSSYLPYSVIVDGIEVDTVGSDEDAKIAWMAKMLNSSTRKFPNVKRKEWDEYIQGIVIQ